MELVSLHILSDVEVKRHRKLHCKYIFVSAPKSMDPTECTKFFYFN